MASAYLIAGKHKSPDKRTTTPQLYTRLSRPLGTGRGSTLLPSLLSWSISGQELPNPPLLIWPNATYPLRFSCAGCLFRKTFCSHYTCTTWLIVIHSLQTEVHLRLETKSYFHYIIPSSLQEFFQRCLSNDC